MEILSTTIRNTVRAVIIRDGHILMQKKQDELKGVRYTLPGGAQEVGESLLEALQRECQEEIATDVIAGEIMHMADFFKQKFQPEPHLQHQLEILFRCQVPDLYTPKNGSKPDKHQVAVEWVAIHELAQTTVFPSFLKKILSTLAEPSGPIYLGKII